MKKAPYQILYEDDQILVIYKERNTFSVKTDDPSTFHKNIYSYLLSYLRKKGETCFPCHRLDYETSGILLFCKDRTLCPKIRKAFEEDQVTRLYEAVVKEEVDLGSHLVHFTKLEQNKQGRVFFSHTGKEAITEVRSINRIQIGTALQIKLHTGRKNQIRYSLHALGYTLLGDQRYSHSEAKRLYLNAYSLSLPESLGLKQSTFFTAPLWLTL